MVSLIEWAEMVRPRSVEPVISVSEMSDGDVLGRSHWLYGTDFQRYGNF